MDLIKEDYWTSYLVKHKEFRESLNLVNENFETLLVGPVSEVVLFSSQFFVKYFQRFSKLDQDAKEFLQNLRKKTAFRAKLDYDSQDLKVFADESEGFEYVRRMVFEGNAEIVKDFQATGSNELHIKAGERFLLRSGDFHQNWCKGVSVTGKKGFIPKACVQVFTFSQILSEPDREYKIKPLFLAEFCGVCKEHVESVKGMINIYQKMQEVRRNERNLVSLVSNLMEISAVCVLLLKEIENQVSVKDFLVFLPLYTESFMLCLKIMQKSQDKLQLSSFVCSVIAELVRVRQKGFVSAVRTYCYTIFIQDRSSWISETIEILSLALWTFNKTLQTVPTDKEILALLEDSRQKSIKRLTVQQSSLILLPDFIVFAAVPVKIQKVLPLSSVLNVSAVEETLTIQTFRKTHKFQMDSNKRAAGWGAELNTLVLRNFSACGICKEVNLIKVVTPCSKCNKAVCWVCECSHIG